MQHSNRILGVAGALWLCVPAAVSHAQHALNVRSMAAAELRIDGQLGDWRGVRFASLGESEDGALEYALGYDASALYLAARVRDDQLVRTPQPSPREDAIVLTLVMPRSPGRPQATEVWLFAGIAGKQAAVASVAAPGAAPERTQAISIVEGPLAAAARGSYVLEARVPWSAVPGAGEFQVARAALRLHDVDGEAGARPRVLASARADRTAELPPLLCEGGANAAIDDFLRAKSLGRESVRHDFVGDVLGDARLERVVVAGTHAVVAGPDLEGGKGFHFHDLPVAMAAGVRTAELRDLTGDGKAELALRLRQQNELGARELLYIVELAAGAPRRVFALELRKETEHGSVEAELEIAAGKRGEAPAIEVRIGSARGLDAGNYREQPSRGDAPILLPWGEVGRRVYRWNGSAFAVAEEEPNRAAVPPRGKAHVPPPREPEAPQARPEPARVVHRQPSGTAELIEAFREARGLDAAVKPRFVQHANVAEDGRLESLLLFGKDLLVIGKGYRAGTGYFYYTLPVPAGEDIQRVFTADVTGDGRRELFVRFKQRTGDVQREILLSYTFAGDAAEAIAAVEVRRAQGERSVGNVVALVPAAGHWALRIAPGTPRGWDAQSYPFVAESLDAYEPLLLPWKDRAAQYRFDGRQLVIEPVRAR